MDGFCCAVAPHLFLVLECMSNTITMTPGRSTLCRQRRKRAARGSNMEEAVAFPIGSVTRELTKRNQSLECCRPPTQTRPADAP